MKPNTPGPKSPTRATHRFTRNLFCDELKNCFYQILIVAIFFSTGCNNSTDLSPIVPQVSSHQATNEKVLIRFGEFENFEGDWHIGKYYATKEYSTVRTPVDRKEFEKLISSVIGNIPIAHENIFSIVLFYDKKNLYDPIDITNVANIGFYFVDNNKATFSLYPFVNGVLLSTPELVSSAAGVYSQSLTYILHHKTIGLNEIGFAVVFDYEFNYEKIKWRYEKIATDAARARKQDYKDLITPRAPECDCPIVTEVPNCHYVTTECEYTFGDDNGICPGKDYRSEIANYFFMQNNDSVYFAFDTSLHYDLRDNVLVNKDIGVKITSYYYELGAMIEDYEIDAPIALKLRTFRFLYKMHEPIEELVEQSNTSYIFLSNQNALDLLDILDDYKALSSLDPWEVKIDDIKLEVNAFKGQTVGYVIANL